MFPALQATALGNPRIFWRAMVIWISPTDVLCFMLSETRRKLLPQRRGSTSVSAEAGAPGCGWIGFT